MYYFRFIVYTPKVCKSLHTAKKMSVQKRAFCFAVCKQPSNSLQRPHKLVPRLRRRLLRRRRILVTAVGVRWRKAAIDLMEKSARISRLTRSSWRLTRTGPVVSLRRKPSSNWSASVSSCCQSSSVTGAAVVSFLRKSRQASETEKRCFIRRRRCSSSSRQRKVCASSCFSSVSCRQRLSLSVS